ncbi:MAG: TVP38/TMEM64 family protein [Candidatus Dojkabacteria bacterium]
MNISKKVVVEILKFTIIIVVIYFFLKIFFVPLVSSDQFKEFVQNVGILGYFILITYHVLTQVFAPLSGTPGVILSITLYGLGTGMLILYIGSIISSIINFYISRKFGRRWVIKLVGEKGMKEVDAFTAVEGDRALIASRLLGFSIFEFISYAAGLTKIPFKIYIVITIITSGITHTLSYFLFKEIDFNSERGIILWIVFIFGAGLIFGILVRSYLKKKKRGASEGQT